MRLSDDVDEDCGDYDEPADCDCDDYEADILTGVATCWRCGNRWHMSSDELKANLKIHADWEAGREALKGDGDG